MSRYRKVDPRIWNDAKFRDLGDDGKLAFLFLLTHPHMTAIGAMRATLPGLAAEIGWTAEAFREAFRKASDKGMAVHDEKASMMWLPNFLKYNRPESPNVVKAWVGALALLPECGLLTRVIAESVAFAEALPKGFAEALPEAFAKGMPYQEQEQEQEQDKSTSTSSPAGDLLPCPVDEIVSLYHALMPANPRCKVLNPARRGAVKQRWLEAARLDCSPFGYQTRAEGLEAWKGFFSVCAESAFLTGRAKPTPGKPPFFADVDFLFSPGGFAKCLENRYHREAA